jgi:broad specificity phosphatase PhoE
MGTKILLVRHGHVEGIHPERFRGRAEIPLSTLGEKQRLLTASRIKESSEPVIVLTSSLGRCIATGEAIAAACAVQSQSLPELYDIDYGAWQWKTHDEIRQSEPLAFECWKKFPDQMQMPEGESLQQVLVRATQALTRILKEYEGQTVVVVSHDSVNRVLLLHILGLPLSKYWSIKQDPCCINEVAFDEGVFQIKSINETWHLQSLDK